jgi:hypothetical protein
LLTLCAVFFLGRIGYGVILHTFIVLYQRHRYVLDSAGYDLR